MTSPSGSSCGENYIQDIDSRLKTLKEAISTCKELEQDLKNERARLVIESPLSPRDMIEALRAHCIAQVLCGKRVSFYTEDALVTVSLQYDNSDSDKPNWRRYWGGHGGNSYSSDCDKEDILKEIATAIAFPVNI